MARWSGALAVHTPRGIYKPAQYRPDVRRTFCKKSYLIIRTRSHRAKCSSRLRVYKRDENGSQCGTAGRPRMAAGEWSESSKIDGVAVIATARGIGSHCRCEHPGMPVLFHCVCNFGNGYCKYCVFCGRMTETMTTLFVGLPSGHVANGRGWSEHLSP